MSVSNSKLGVTIPAETLDCCCWANINYIFSLSVIKMYKENCTDYTITWQFLNTVTDTWDDISSTDPGFISNILYNPFETGAKGAGLYRLKIAKTKCCTTFSNFMEAYLA